jgi:hypothetical protein
MNKEVFIRRYGVVAYKKKLESNSAWKRGNPNSIRRHDKTWRDSNPDRVEAKDHERNRKGGKYYEEKVSYMKTGVPGERHRIRTIDARRWRKYKKIIAPESQVHHEWISGTSRYRGIALVERNAHQRGIIDVIRVLHGKITLLIEE